MKESLQLLAYMYLAQLISNAAVQVTINSFSILDKKELEVINMHNIYEIPNKLFQTSCVM